MTPEQFRAIENILILSESTCMALHHDLGKECTSVTNMNATKDFVLKYSHLFRV